MAKPARNRFHRVHALVFVAFIVVVTVVALQTNLAAQADSEMSAPRESEVCLGCHEEMGTSLTHSPHALAEDPDHPDTWIACTDCHIGDSRHYDEDPEEFPMSNPADQSPGAVGEVCAFCHMNSHQQNMMEGNVHTMNDVSCTGCHGVHEGEDLGLLHETQTDLCLSCHPAVKGQFNQPFRHPVNDHIVECSECHMTLDRTSDDLSFNGTNVCTTCHMEFKGPFPYEHQATVDYSTEEGGCITCHAPHGSAQPRMLKQPYEPPHFQLCTQCHSVPPKHQFNAFHGERWAGIECNDCHTDIHGSYTNRYFLRESLGGEGCLSSGCHGN